MTARDPAAQPRASHIDSASFVRTPQRLAALTAAVLSAAVSSGCQDIGSDPSSPHPVRSDVERYLAERYGSFAGALEADDRKGICRDLTQRLAHAYACELEKPLDVPTELRELDVRFTPLFAATDPSVPDAIAIVGLTDREDGGRLILTFRRTSNRTWEITKAGIGSYGS